MLVRDRILIVKKTSAQGGVPRVCEKDERVKFWAKAKAFANQGVKNARGSELSSISRRLRSNGVARSADYSFEYLMMNSESSPQALSDARCNSFTRPASPACSASCKAFSMAIIRFEAKGVGDKRELQRAAFVTDPFNTVGSGH